MALLHIDSPTTVSYDPYSEEALTDPTALYRALRAHYPVYPLPQYDAWAFSRFEDVWAIGEDSERFALDIGPVFDPADLARSNHGAAPELPPVTPYTSFSQVDPPLQTTLRQGIGAPLRPGPVARLEDHIRQTVRDRLDLLAGRGEFDLYTDFGGFVSATVMCGIVGLDPAHAPRVLQLVNGTLERRPPGPVASNGAAFMELHQMLLAAIAARRADPDGPRIPAMDGLINTQVDGVPLSDDEIAAQLGAIIQGGTETVPKIAARCLLELSRRPEQLAEVRANPAENVRIAIEETMRFGAPLQYVGRTAMQDVEIGGAQIRAGQRVFLLIAAANRDDREFENPDEFIWNRPIARHFAFGHGVHFCIGVHLARLEARILVEEVLTRIPSFELDESRALMPPSDFQLGYIQLPLLVR